MIERKNILDLIGGYKDRYHSCIMTCFSFDFSFFEERVLRSMRRAGVQNVNVLVDGNYLAQLQEITTGKEFKNKEIYSFYPVYASGVFHPKIMLLTGKRDGLLVIGSGNITSSGVSTNDEIWGAFHLNSIDNLNAPIFQVVWQYLKRFINDVPGFLQERFSWFNRYSEWLNDLPSTEDWVDLADYQIKFLANTEQSIFQRLIENIPSYANSLTLIAPFYDSKGEQIHQLKNQFQPAEVRSVLDLKTGLLPTEITDTESIQFYNWQACVSSESDRDKHNRLHAKMLHFLFDEEEYLVIGSANITRAAMGNSQSTFSNEEAGLLLKRRRKEKSWLDELGINTEVNPIKLEDFKKQKQQNESLLSKSFPIKLRYAELTGDTLLLFLKEKKEFAGNIVLNDREETILKKIEVGFTKTDIIKLNIEDIDNPEEIFKISIFNFDEKRISNYCIIHREESMRRGNPDPKRREIESLLKDYENDDDGLAPLLDYMNLEWADDDNDSYKSVPHGSGENPIAINIERSNEREYEQLSEEEFNKVDMHKLYDLHSPLDTSNTKIAELIYRRLKSLENHEDYKDDAEQSELVSEEKGNTKTEIQDQKRDVNREKKEIRATHQLFKRLNQSFKKELKGFFRQPRISYFPYLNAQKEIVNEDNGKVTLKMLTSMLIAFHMIGLKQLTVDRISSTKTNEQDDSNQVNDRSYRLYYGKYEQNNETSIKGFLAETLGLFHLLMANGFMEYPYESVNRRMSREKIRLLANIIFTVHNRRIIEKDQDFIEFSLLNSLYFLGEENLLDERTRKKLQDEINILKNRYQTSEFLEENLSNFENGLFLKYLQWLRAYFSQNGLKNQLFRGAEGLKTGTIIFNSKLGFNRAERIEVEERTTRLNLWRPGYVNKKTPFLVKDITLGKKMLVFELNN